jgi:hypothetical protein
MENSLKKIMKLIETAARRLKRRRTREKWVTAAVRQAAGMNEG